MVPSIKMPGFGDRLEMAENALNIKIAVKSASLLERLLQMDLAHPNTPTDKNISIAYLAALSLPYLDLKSELFFEADTTDSTLAYE